MGRRTQCFVEMKFSLSRIDPCEVQSDNARYIRTYFICIRPKEMAGPLMSLADTLRKTFSTFPSSFGEFPLFSICRETDLNASYVFANTPALLSFQRKPSTSTRHTTRLSSLLRIRSRISAWIFKAHSRWRNLLSANRHACDCKVILIN